MLPLAQLVRSSMAWAEPDHDDALAQQEAIDDALEGLEEALDGVAFDGEALVPITKVRSPSPSPTLHPSVRRSGLRVWCSGRWWPRPKPR